MYDEQVAGADCGTGHGRGNLGGHRALSPGADGAWRHLAAIGVADRAEAVRALAAYPQRHELTDADVTALIRGYPPMRWDAAADVYMALIDEITPGGLTAALADMPDDGWYITDAAPCVIAFAREPEATSLAELE